jgi:hypothetical protein
MIGNATQSKEDLTPHKLEQWLSNLSEPAFNSLMGEVWEAAQLELSKAQQSTAPIWTPFPNSPQALAYESAADELLYGGAAGGGKTDLLLGLAGTQHYSSIIFRREFPLLRNIVERSREIFNQRRESHLRDSYNESLHIWRLVDDRMIEFAAMQYEKDRENFRGRPHDFYGWDEITEFTESQYRFVNGWLRTTRTGQRCRVVAAGNPPTDTEGEWVIQYWGAWLDPQHPNKAKPSELCWVARIDDKDIWIENDKPITYKQETIIPRSRTFIPAFLADNPILAATSYGSVLQGMPEPLRSQLLYGDYSIRYTDNAYQVIPRAWVEAAQARWTDTNGNSLTAIGGDVSRGGDDKSVLARRHGVWYAPLLKYAGRDITDGQAFVARLLPQMRDEAIAFIDVIGIGASAYDIARMNGLPVVGVNWSEGTQDTDRSGRLHFTNTRARDWWRMREALDPHNGMSIALPPDPELLADLCAPRWTPQANGIRVESKEDIKKRLGRSPDCGDAVVLALNEPLHAEIGVIETHEYTIS